MRVFLFTALNLTATMTALKFVHKNTFRAALSVVMKGFWMHSKRVSHASALQRSSIISHTLFSEGLTARIALMAVCKAAFGWLA